ncbi:alpha/beta hydrolase [Microbacterium sp. HD4P20]|uniref:alpha/beta hydrolase n=1 Tax=Microbacterium sp. HD4P20 TaxID=2864874 RepID=UPI001C6408FB|nr:alpha/beta hydrolase [Microbacterium sp. HD4P20]MCP2638237.1 alpha/beta hydrolase [Microbacterium sp. HD4P20]
MPLDPFFDERLRTHRKYLIDRALGNVRARLTALWPFARSAGPAAVAAAEKAPAAAVKSADLPAPTGTGTPQAGSGPALGPRSRARAKHRKAALAWDRRELKTVGTPGPKVRATEHRLAPDGAPPFRVRIYYPEPPRDGGSDGTDARPVPAALTFFGGAFRIGGIDYPTTDAAHRRRALDAGVAIVAVDYALAPEHRYPVPVEQAYAALTWLFAQAPDLGIDAARIGVAGTSAGANIAAALTLANRDRAARPLLLQVLEVPVVDLTGRSLDLSATRALRIPSLIALRELRSVARTYLADPRQAREAYASPLLASSHEGLPPAVILTAEYDPLRGDGDAYGAALRRAGVDASVVRYQGVTHDTPIFTGVLPAARRWHEDVVTALRRLHA